MSEEERKIYLGGDINEKGELVYVHIMDFLKENFDYFNQNPDELIKIIDECNEKL